MMFLIFLVVACVNGHQNEPGHHVIPYKGKYHVRNNFIPIIIWLGVNNFLLFVKCHERNIIEKLSRVRKTALNCREVYNNTRRKYY